MEPTLKYAEHKLDEAIKQGEPDETIAYWRGYRDCAKALQKTCNNVATGCKPLTLEQMKEVPHGEIKDSTLQSICDRANEIAYPPAHIDREAWTAEWTVDEFGHKCSKCGEYLPDGETDWKPQFCPWCGKAMTPEAWAELEKRMRG